MVLYAHVSLGERTIGPLVAAVQACSLTPSTTTTTTTSSSSYYHQPEKVGHFLTS
jgi:hypothetical protein